MSWLSQANANNFKQSYVQGFFDICGELIIRRNGLTSFSDSSFNSNLRVTKSLTVDDNNFSRKIFVNNPTTTGVNPSTQFSVLGATEFLGNVNIQNNASTNLNFGGTGSSQPTSKINDSGSSAPLVLASLSAISLNANPAMTDNSDMKIGQKQIELNKPLACGNNVAQQNKIIFVSDVSVNNALSVFADISGSQNLYLDGSANIKGNILAKSATFTEPITFASQKQQIHSIEILNDSKINASLFVDNILTAKTRLVSQTDTSLNSTKLYGSTFAFGKSYFINDASFGGNVVIGTATAGDIGKSLSVVSSFISQTDTSLNSTKLYGSTYAYGNTYFTKETDFTGNVRISNGKSLTCETDTSLNITKLCGSTYAFGKSYFSNDASFGSWVYANNIDVSGTSIFRDRITCLADVYFNSNVRFGETSSSVFIGDLSANKQAKFAGVRVHGDMQTDNAIIGTQTINNTSTFNGTVSFTNNTTVSTQAGTLLSIQGNVEVKGQKAEFTTTPKCLNGINITGTLDNTGTITSSGTIHSGTKLTTTGNVEAKDASLSGNISSVGASFSGNVSVSNEFSVLGNTTLGNLVLSNIVGAYASINDVSGDYLKVNNVDICGNLYANKDGTTVNIRTLNVMGGKTTLGEVETATTKTNGKTQTNELAVDVKATIPTANITIKLNAPYADISNIENGGSISSVNLYAHDASFSKCDICGNLYAKNSWTLTGFVNSFSSQTANMVDINASSLTVEENVLAKNIVINPTTATLLNGNLNVGGNTTFTGVSYYIFNSGTAQISFGGSGIAPALLPIFDMGVDGTTPCAFSFWLYVAPTTFTDVLYIDNVSVIQIGNDGLLQVFGNSIPLEKNKWIMVSIEYNPVAGEYTCYTDKTLQFTQLISQTNYTGLLTTSVVMFSSTSRLLRVRDMKIFNTGIGSLLEDMYNENNSVLTGAGVMSYYFPLTNYYINTSTKKILTSAGNDSYASYDGALLVEQSEIKSKTANNIYEGSVYIGSASPSLSSGYKLNVIGDMSMNGNLVLNGQGLTLKNTSGVGSGSTMNLNNNLIITCPDGLVPKIIFNKGIIISTAQLEDCVAIGMRTGKVSFISYVYQINMDTDGILDMNNGTIQNCRFIGSASATDMNIRVGATNKFVVGSTTNTSNNNLNVVGELSSTGKATFGSNAVISSTLAVGGTTVQSTYNLQVHGNVIASSYNATSDRRLKTNIKEMDTQWENIKSIIPASFQWIDTSKNDIGFIAQDIYRTYPVLGGAGCVDGKLAEEEPVDETGKPVYMAVDYGKMSCILWKGLSEALHVIDTQKKEIEDLRRRVEVLESSQPYSHPAI